MKSLCLLSEYEIKNEIDFGRNRHSLSKLKNTDQLQHITTVNVTAYNEVISAKLFPIAKL